MDSDQDAPPVEHVTIDQVVALNIRQWRREAGMTQEELGRRLGWSAANVSAAERSADPSRDPRRFDAQTLTQLALALGVPLTALLLPPDDDEESTAYIFDGPGGEHDMREFFVFALMPDFADDSPAITAYRRRLDIAAGKYLDPEWREEVGSWTRQVEPDEVRADRAARLRASAASMRAEGNRGAEELESLAAAIYPEGETR
jgi:transcriptional regulator with XRE-family HTH domain